MKQFQAVIEDNAGNVIGAATDQGDVMLEPAEVTPRANLAAVAVTLATKYGVDPASFTLPAEPTP